MKGKVIKASAMIMTCMSILGIAACSSGKKGITDSKIGILQFGEFAALDKAKEGFIKVLKENGVKDNQIDYKNAGGKAADQSHYAKTLADTCDLLLGIATPSAVALKGAEENSGYETPLLFTAVTDAVDAKLVESNENGKGFVCGTTDATPIDEQVALIKEVLPDATGLGILYTQTETNSQVQAEQVKAAAEAAGLSVTVMTCTSSNDIKSTASALASTNGISAIYLPTDNNIAEHMAEVELPARENKVLLVCGEEGMVEDGGHLTLSIDYFKLGEKTGDMAVKILKSEKEPKDFKVEKVALSECAYVLNSTSLEAANINISEEVKSAHNWKDVRNADN